MKKIKQNIIFLVSSVFFLPSFLSPNPTPTTFTPNIYYSSNKFLVSYKSPKPTISGKITYQVLSEVELQAIYKPIDIPIPSDQKLQEWFEHYAGVFNISSETLRNIAYCESHFNPNAINGIYGGMYQYSSSTWISTRNAMGENPDTSLRFNPEESIKTSAFKIASGGIGAWPVCGS